MNPELTSTVESLVNAYVLPLGWKLIGAIAVWILGGWVIRLIRAALGRVMDARHIDKTLAGYLDASANILMKILVLIAVLGVLGIETTSFAALLAALGVAIGAAWAGLLSNFAAGLFLMVLRPFKVGDFIAAAGVTGTVEELGLFVTTINTSDNIRTFVGNNKIFSDNVQNFSANPYRRVDLVAQLHASVDVAAAIRMLRERVAKIPNVTADPAPLVEIQEFTAFGPLLAVRPFCANEHYWQVYFETNRVIRETFGEAGFPAPEQRLSVRSLAG